VGCFFALIQLHYPMYQILHLANIRLIGIDKLYYYVCQADRLLNKAMKNVMEWWNCPRMPDMKLSKCKLSKKDEEFLTGE